MDITKKKKKKKDKSRNECIEKETWGSIKRSWKCIYSDVRRKTMNVSIRKMDLFEKNVFKRSK